jgi:ABC-2 type transport system permease protein
MMREIFYLIPILLKGPGRSFQLNTLRKKILAVVVSCLLVFSLAPMLIGIAGFYLALFITAQSIGDSRLVLDFASLGAATAVFFFGFFSIISLMYLSSDSSIFMPLPLRPASVAIARLLVLAIWEYLVIGFILAPALLVYGWLGGVGLLWWLEAAFILLLFPLGPLASVGILVMLLMRITAISAYRDKLRIVGGSILIIAVIFFQVIFQNVGNIARDPTGLRTVLSGGNLRGCLYLLFPTRIPAADALAWIDGHGLLALLTFTAITGSLLFAFGVIAEKLYYPGLCYNASKNQPKSPKKLPNGNQTLSYKRSGIFSACLWREMRLLFRSPVAFINNVLMNFIWPLFFVIPLFFSGGKDFSVREIVKQIPLEYLDFSAVGVAIMIIFASSANGIGATAISREGYQINYLKALPIPATALLFAKLTAGTYLALIAGAVLFVTGIIIGFPLPHLITALPIGCMAAVLPQLIGLLIDLTRPYLSWDNEVKAIKQNMNVIYTMILSIMAGICCGLIAAVAHYFGVSSGFTVFILSGFLAALCLLLLQQLYRKGRKMLEQISA